MTNLHALDAAETDDADGLDNAVRLGEDPYNLLKLFCPFCGAGLKESCQHQLYRTDGAFFDRISPLFKRFLEQSFGFGEDEVIDEGSLLPARLCRELKNNGGLAGCGVRRLNQAAEALGDGPAAFVLEKENRRRHDRLFVGFASDIGLDVLKKLAETSEKMKPS